MKTTIISIKKCQTLTFLCKSVNKLERHYPKPKSVIMTSKESFSGVRKISKTMLKAKNMPIKNNQYLIKNLIKKLIYHQTISASKKEILNQTMKPPPESKDSQSFHQSIKKGQMKVRRSSSTIQTSKYKFKMPCFTPTHQVQAIMNSLKDKRIHSIIQGSEEKQKKV